MQLTPYKLIINGELVDFVGGPTVQDIQTREIRVLTDHIFDDGFDDG